MRQVHDSGISREDSFSAWACSAPSNRFALLLAGGDGIRLQELTREITGTPIPKQYCRLWHGSSLLEATLARAQIFCPRERISVIINQDHLSLAMSQLSAIQKSKIFIQPLNRDTGPGIVFALLNLEPADPDAIVAVFPTDHYINNDRAFIEHVLHASNTISLMPDKIAILGVAPDRPETGFGYILPAVPVGRSENIYYVEAFTEKPNLAMVNNIILRGGLWNTFIMVFRLSRMLKLVSELMPSEFEKILLLREAPQRAADQYQTLNSWNFSAKVLTRIPEHLIVHKVIDVTWSDWGTRESVERTYQDLNIVPFWNSTNPVPNHQIISTSP
jgi:mannose-1-phosphate guanylyltransferase